MDFSLLDSGRDVSACVNLMPCPDGSGDLMPAAPPASVAVPDGWRPLYIMPDGRILLASGSSMGFAARGVVTHRAALDSAPLHCLYVGDTLVLLTASRLYRLGDDLAVLPDPADAMPALRAVASGNIRLDTPAVRLGATYSAGDRFSAADNRAVIAAVADTVRDIDDRARMAGLMWQPVICRLRGLDARGTQLFATEPMLLVGTDGAEADISVRFTSADGRNLAPATSEVPVWQPQIVWPEGCDPAAAGVCTVELQCTPVLYSHDLSKGRVTPRRRSDEQWICSVSFGDLDTAAAGNGLLRRMLDVTGRIDALAAPAWSGRVTTGMSPAPVTVQAARAGNLDDDIATLRHALAKPVEAAAYADATLAGSRTFTAAAMAAAGDTVLYADPVAGHPAPPHPAHFFARTAAGAWHAYVEVTFADGSTMVSQALGLSDAPLSFGPMLSVGAPDAVSVTIGMRTAGGLGSTGTFPLVPDPSGRCAVYVAPGAKPFTLGDTSPVFAIPEAKPATVAFQGYIAIARAAAPHIPLCALHAGAGRILALRGAEAAQSAWDYGRSRFHMFTDTGLHSLKVDVGRRSFSATHVDSRMLDSPQALAVTDDGLAASLAGDIVLLQGNGIRTLMRLPGVLGLAYAHSHHELWCITAGDTQVLCTDSRYARYTLTTALDPAGTVECPGGDALVTDTGGTVRLAGHSEPVLGIDVEWRGGIRFDRLVRGMAMLRADITGTFSPITIALHRRALTRVCPAPELQLTAAGPLYSPMGRRTFTAPMREAEILITATATPSSRLRSIRFSQPVGT